MLVACMIRSLECKWYVACVFLGELSLTTFQPDTTHQPGATNVSNAYLMYNEFICYNVAQVRLRYLLRVKM